MAEFWNDFFQFRLNIDISAVNLLSIFWHNLCWPYVIRGAPNPKSKGGGSYLHPKLYNTVEFQPPTRGRRPARAGPAFSGFPHSITEPKPSAIFALFVRYANRRPSVGPTTALTSSSDPARTWLARRKNLGRPSSSGIGCFVFSKSRSQHCLELAPTCRRRRARLYNVM